MNLVYLEEMFERAKIRGNVDEAVVDDFGREWKALNQSQLSELELTEMFNDYFRIFPFDRISTSSTGFDMGCGSGRWARLIAPKVGTLNCIDPSPLALDQARLNLAGLKNCVFECATVADSSLADGSQDFGYCLGVLHHIPDTRAGLRSCVRKLRKGAPLLVYLYYSFDNRPVWFRAIWKSMDFLRRGISKLPFPLKLVSANAIALVVYLPLARLAWALEWLGCPVGNIPLSFYRRKSFYTMRTDALDRFGTRLEKRFSKIEMRRMLLESGLEGIKFSPRSPFWCAVGTKA